MNTLQMALADGMTITKRNALKIKRAPDLLGGVVMLPIVFVLLFAYVFGSMIELPGMSYTEYLLPGIFVMTITTSAQITGYTLTLDLQKGIFDRFRTLPMSPSAVLTGQTAQRRDHECDQHRRPWRSSGCSSAGASTPRRSKRPWDSWCCCCSRTPSPG